MRLIIHAPNVHQGGGRTLLATLIAALPEEHEYTLQADTRFGLPPSTSNISVIRVPPTLSARYAAEWRLRTLAGGGDAVLCIGNLPPLFSVSAPTYLLLQNRYLCEPAPLNRFSTGTRLRIHIERLWLRGRIRNVDRIIVQTRSMQHCVRAALGVDAAVLPFFRDAAPVAPTRLAEPIASDRKFLYVASSDPHKNHASLFEAWRMLAADGLRPELHLTLPENSPYARETERLREAGMSLINHGDVANVQALYRSCDALVFPSMMESFGLPLLEAQAAGLAVIAAERDYVRDIIEPDQTFDPDSARSIARAVKRYLGVAEPRPDILSPRDFVDRILRGDI